MKKQILSILGAWVFMFGGMSHANATTYLSVFNEIQNFEWIEPTGADGIMIQNYIKSKTGKVGKPKQKDHKPKKKASVPEPSTILLFGTALAVLACIIIKRKNYHKIAKGIKSLPFPFQPAKNRRTKRTS